MPRPLRISVALPVCRLHPHLERAVDCILAQQAPDGIDLDLMLIANGIDPSLLAPLKERSASVRILHLERPSLPAALNLALRQARFDLVARMDDDDECPPTRLARQARFLRDHPPVAAVGSAYEIVSPAGIRTMRPPTDPGPLYARLLLGNCLAHGSMMLQRDPILDAGGYDERLDKAQDYELWLRLARDRRLACLDEVLYRHHAACASPCSSEAQARAAARAMLEAWRDLPPSQGNLEQALTQALVGNHEDARSILEEILRTTPSREALLGWLWLSWSAPGAQTRAIEACRRSRLREVGARLRHAGVGGVYLYGAGNHARWILDHRHDLALPILAIVDDALAGSTAHGYHIQSPATLQAGDCALIASDAHEDTIWAHTAPLRARGVRIERLYDDEPAGVRLAS